MLWAVLIIATYFEMMMPVYLLMALLLFEGVTNWRVPIIISRIRYGKKYNEMNEEPPCGAGKLGKVEAERMLRFIVAIFVLVPFYLAPQLIWFLPWFVAGMLILAGITNICPMVIFLRWSGMR